jgi:hypothetical protein
MIVFFGNKLYGKVDHVPGLFYVATQFFYVQFVPLVPLGSYVVMEGSEKGEGQFAGVSIGLSFKSLLMAWLRAGLLVGGILALIFGFIEFAEVNKGGSTGKAVGLIAAAIGCGVLFWVTYFFVRAGPLRALKLANKAGIAPEVVAQFFVNHPGLAELEQARQQEE